MSRLAVVGAGSWGTALSVVLSRRFDEVALWAFDPGLAASIREIRENATYLPGVSLPENVRATDRLDEAVRGARVVLYVVPSPFLRRVVRDSCALVPNGASFVSATKGLEKGSLARMSQVIAEELGGAPVAVLSGPTFAREVAGGGPAAVVISSTDLALAGEVQSMFSGPTFRLYTNGDPVGVEIGAALKNVIAIGAGICQGLELGHNSVAALVTRGLAEITRLAGAVGGEARTLAGLAGLGDLVLTCTGDLSRNRRVGIELAAGRKLREIVASTKTVAEGVETTAAAVQLALQYGVEMPITFEMHEILENGRDPREGMRRLMERSLRSE